MAGETRAAQQIGDQRRLARDDASGLPQHGGYALALDRNGRSRYPRRQPLARRRIARKLRQFADLRDAVLDPAGDPEGDHCDPHVLQRGAGRGGEERARHHHIGVQREHFLGRPASDGEAARMRYIHRAGARIVAVMRDREQLCRVCDLRQHCIAAGVEADDARSGWQAFGQCRVLNLGRATLRASRQQQRRQPDPDHICALTPRKAPRPGEP